MTRLRILVFAAVCACAVPAIAQKTAPLASRSLPSLSNVGRTAPADSRHPALAFPIVEYSSSDGGSPMPRGIIAGRQIAPGTVLGLGIFQREPARRRYVGEMPQNNAPKKTKQAAIGLSMKF